MIEWQSRNVPLKYQLSDWTLFSISLPLKVRTARLSEGLTPATDLSPPHERPEDGYEGYLLRAFPVASELPRLSSMRNYIRYVMQQYRHSYIDLEQSFAEYQKKFSSKTRSTINRKVRKYAEHCGGRIAWHTYQTPSEMPEFLGHARTVSEKTYQERLLDAGMPDSPDFLETLEQLANAQRVRGYILFDGERPVSYLYCPIDERVLIYAHLGYDPHYRALSVGTVLLWLALEQLFGERRFLYFDFTEGQSDQKQQFATHEIRCANALFLRKSIRNKMVVLGHIAIGSISMGLGRLLSRLGLKARIKRMLRFARR